MDSDSEPHLPLLLITIGLVALVSLNIAFAESITVTGKPSASSNLTYKYYTMTWDNYCPLCGADNSLIRHNGAYKGTYVPEGELSCISCGADYCIVTGKDKASVCRAYLSKASVLTLYEFVIINLTNSMNNGFETNFKQTTTNKIR